MNKKIVIVQKKESSSDKKDISSKEQSYKTFNSEAMNNMEQGNFEELFEKSMLSFNRGDIIDGTIVGIKDGIVFIDIGYKREGKVKSDEFEEEPRVGETVRVMVMSEVGDDNLALSKRKVDIFLGKQLIEKASLENSTVSGKIVQKIKGGYKVLVSGVECFLPLSQVDFERIVTPSIYIDKVFTFKISKYEPEKNNIVISRKAYLEVERIVKQDKLFKEIKVGDEVLATVKKIKSYGAFVNIDNIIDGFVYVKDLAWVHVKDCTEVFSEGDEVKFKVLKVDPEERKINLGLKHMTRDPWHLFAEEHKVGDVLKGEVVRIVNFGAFIKIADGVDGLIHLKELSWTKRINHPSEVLKVNDFIESKILGIDKENRRLSLSLREVLPNPLADIENNYPRDKIVEGKISSITAFGVFVELEEGIIGLLHKDNIDWTKKLSNPKQHNFKVGNTIKVIVLSSSVRDQSISLGLKQLEENPWAIFKSNHAQGSQVKGEIISFGDNGIYVKVDGIETFLHSSDVIKQKDEKIEDLYKKGDMVEAVVKHIDVNRNRINISVRVYEKRKEEAVIKKYLVKDNSKTGGGATLGDFINFDRINK